MRFPVKITSSSIWVAIPVDWVIIHWYACAADGRSGDRSVYGHVITKFSRMGSLPHFFTHGAPLRALRTRQLRYESVFEIFWNEVLRIIKTVKLHAIHTIGYYFKKMISFGNAASSHSGLIPLKTAYKKRGELLWAIASKKNFINLHSAAFDTVFGGNLVHA